MSEPLVVGVDVGGTKTQVRAVDSEGAVVTDVVVATRGWEALDADAARWLARTVTDALGGRAALSVVVGAHGVETVEHARELGDRTAAVLRASVTIVNDAELVVPAAGLQDGIGVIAGTGSIVVGRDRSGARLRAAGWGWVLSDPGSASALVRDAVAALLRAEDAGRPDAVLRAHLLESVGVPDVPGLVHRLSWAQGPERWGDHSPAVTGAAAAGSHLATEVLAAGAEALAACVRDLVSRGADGSAVVLAGGLLAAVPEQRERVADAVRRFVPGVHVRHLAEAPVAGAVNLALARCGRGS